MDEKPRQRPRSGFVSLTPEMISALYAQRDRTGIGVPDLARNHLDPALRITPRQVHQWMLGLINSAEPERYGHVLRAWEQLPSQAEGYVFYSPEVRALMDAERTRTGVAAINLFTRENLPEGLTVNRIRNFYCGVLTRMQRGHFDCMMRRWRALPGVCESVTMTADILAELRAAIARTNKGPTAILRGARDKPEGLKAALVQTWITGKTRTARRAHIDYLMERYNAAAPASSTKRGRPLTHQQQ